MGFDYVNALHNLKPTELGSRKDLPPEITDITENPKVLEVKLIEVAFPDQIARPITANFVNNSVINSIVPNIGICVNTGPIIGIVEWGVGGGYNRIEFNLPPAFLWRQNGDFTGAPLQGENGVTLTLCCSALRLLARNDARQPPANDPTAMIGSRTDLNGNVSGFIAQGQTVKPCAPLQRAYIVVSANGAVMVPGAGAVIGIPRFAKRVRFPRQPLAEPLTVAVGGEIAGSAYNETIAAGGQGQIELSPLANTLGITNAGVNNISTLTAVFDLEL